jgi:hypothetical protein
MASALLNAASASASSPTILAEGVQIGQGGMLSRGSISLVNGASITTTSDANFTGVVGGDGGLFLTETPLPALGAKQAWRFVVPAAGAEEGQLGVVGWDYTNPAAPVQKEVLRMSAAPRAGAAVNQCILNFTAPSQSGIATMSAGTPAAQVVLVPGLTAATGAVQITALTAFAADQARPPVAVVADGQFTITLSAASAGTKFAWFVHHS